MSLIEELFRVRDEILKPAPKLSLVEWADAHRHLSKESSSEAGRWKTTRVEAARGPMEAVTDPSVEMITVMAPTQLLKTELLNNIVGYYVHQDPSPMILVQPTKETAEAWSKDRLDPMIRDSPVLRGKMGARHGEAGNTILHKSFNGGHITMVGANAPSGLASRPIRIVLCDETDKYPQSAGKEGDPIKLVTERAATFWNRLVVLVCSPTIDGHSRIQQSYFESDQRKFYTPCPKCNEFQVMEWEQVKYPEDEPAKAKYFCIECDHPWTEAQRLKAISKSVWRATAPFRGHAGFHCSKLVSPWEPITRLAQKYEDAKGKAEQMKTFVNTQLARTYKEDTDVPDWRRIYERRENYERNVVPKEAAIITMGVDIQRNRMELEIVAWGPRKNSWSLDYRIIEGAPNESKTWDALEKVIYEEFKIEGARHTRGIDKVAIDSGDSTQDVYYFTRRFPSSRVMCIKGRDSLDAAISLPSPVDVNWNGKRIGRGQQVWGVGSSKLKGELYGWLNKASPLDGEDDPYGYCHFPMYGEEYFKMLTAEELAAKLVNGYTKRQWIKVRERNESLDCRIYARAAASAKGLDRRGEEVLKARARKLNATENETETETPARNAPKTETTPKRKRKRSKIKSKPSSWL